MILQRGEDLFDIDVIFGIYSFFLSKTSSFIMIRFFSKIVIVFYAHIFFSVKNIQIDNEIFIYFIFVFFLLIALNNYHYLRYQSHYLLIALACKRVTNFQINSLIYLISCSFKVFKKTCAHTKI